MKMKKVAFVWSLLFLVSVMATGGSMINITQVCQNRVVSTIALGSRGSTVTAIQQSLREKGFYNGSADGIFGQGTYDAVRRFQESNGLKVDGIVGASTLEALGIDTNGNIIIGNESEYDEDVRLLAAAIHGEGRGEPYEGQVAIGAVILNRVESPDFPNTIPGVIYQRGAFDAVADNQISLTPNETAYRAARDALNGWDPSEGSLYYWNPVTATSKWIWSVPIKKTIGRHVFGSKD